MALTGCRKGPNAPEKQGAAQATPRGPLPVFPPAEGVTWPTPPGWTRASFPLPPAFAPELPKGYEEVLRAPGFATEGAPDFQSMVFVWLLPESFAVDVPALGQALDAYFKGLCQRFGAPAPHFHTDLAPVAEPGMTGNEAGDTFRGTTSGPECDPFVHPLTLRLRVHTVDCAEGQRRAVVVLASPQQDGGPVWHELEQRYREFSCR